MEINNTNEKSFYTEKKKFIDITPKFIAILSFIILNTIFVITIYNKSYEKKDILRLHIVANSNSIEDQLVKLKVSEKINTYISSLSNLCDSKEEMISLLKDSNNEIIEIADSTLKDNGFDYDTKLKIGKISYDKKESLSVNMEKGTYDSIQVVLGDGNGKNFWTLIFPNEENIKKLENYNTIMPFISNIYGDENEDINSKTEITNNKDKEYTFKFLEIIDRIKEKI